MWPTGRYLNEPVLDHAFAHSQANRGTRHSIVCPQLDALRRFLCKLAGQVTEKQNKKRVIQAKCIWMYSTSSGSQEHVYWKNSENLQKKQKTHAGFKYSWGPKLTVVSFLCAFFFCTGFRPVSRVSAVHSLTSLQGCSRSGEEAIVDTCAVYTASAPVLSYSNGWEPPSSFVVRFQPVRLSLWVRALHKLWSLSSHWDINNCSPSHTPSSSFPMEKLTKTMWSPTGWLRMWEDVWTVVAMMRSSEQSWAAASLDLDQN